MYSEYRFETDEERVGWWAVPGVKEVVVLQPVGEGVVVHHPPSSRPHLLHKLLRLLRCLTGPRQKVLHPGVMSHLQIFVIFVLVIVASESSL